MMMPSRGLVSAAGASRQAARINRRFISTAPSSRNVTTPIRQPVAFSSSLLHNSSSRSSSLSSWRSSRIAGASAMTFVAAQSRLASTASTAAPAAATATPATGSDATATSIPGPLDNTAAEATSSFDISGISDTYLTGIPEQIGYLKEIGLDYGWGPTAMIEWALEHIHVYSGMPWWGSIIATAVCFRLCLLPLFKKSSDIGARQAAMLPVTKPLSTKMMEAMKAGDNDGMARYRAQLQAINKQAGISTSAMLTPALIQGVFGFCAFRLMRAMANLPVPGLETGGALWFTDLTQSDPYMLLPAVMALSMHTVFRFGGESGAPMTNPAMKPLMLYVMPCVIFISTLWMPANLDLWLATTGISGIAQVTTFRNPAVRKALGMSPLVPSDPRSPHPHHKDTTTSNTIDVKGTSRPYAQSIQARASLRYQAPNIKTVGGRANNANLPTQEEKDRIGGMVDAFYKNMNTVGDGIKTFRDNTVAKAAQLNGSTAKKESKTRSKEFLRQADLYEQRWKKLHNNKDDQNK
ncbi:hypothetical protein AAFC00_003321 [Neodothiora populina]|uniref:Membrane insertase YidC/Oxa/ALB C-terminal domain-containing protein n=1 Tax=Neodothiora populina TaxID=2781224 RepID=A0ABR3PAA5_9PEZI